MRTLFSDKTHWQVKMRAIEAKLCRPLINEVFSCGLGCFRVFDIAFIHNDIERDGNKSHLGVWLRPIGGVATDHLGRVGYTIGKREDNLHAISMRDFLKHYERA